MSMPELLVTAKAVDEASDALKSLAGNAEASMGQIETSVEGVDAANKSMDASMTQLVTGFSGVATSAMNLYNAYDRVQTAQFAVDKANLTVKSSLNAVEDAQNKYNNAVAKYGADSAQAVAAANDLSLAQERYQLAVAKADLVQGNLNTTIINSAISVIPTLITMISSVEAITGAWTAAQQLLNIVMNANPILIVVTAIGLLIAAIVYCYETYAPFREAVNAAGAALMNALKPAIDAVVNALTWLWSNVVVPAISAFQAFWNLIINNPILALVNPITTIIYLIENWGTITTQLGEIWNTIISGLQAVWDTYIGPLIGAIQGFMDAVSKAFTDLSTAVSGIWSAIMDGLMAVWNATVGPLIDAVNDFCSMVGDAFTDLYNWLVGGSEWDDMCNELTTSWDATSAYLTAATSELIDAIKAEFEELSTSITATMDKTWADIQSGFNSMVNYLYSGCEYLASHLPPIVEEGWDEIIATYEAMVAELEAELEDLQSEAVEESIWPDMLGEMEDQTEESLGNIVDAFANANKEIEGKVAIVTTKGFKIPGAAGPTLPVTPPTVPPSISTSINVMSPLVYVEGSADKATAQMAAAMVQEALKSVVIEASSPNAPATKKRVRLPELLAVI